MLWAWDVVGRQSVVVAWCMRIGKGESNVRGVKESVLNAWHAIFLQPPSPNGSSGWDDDGIPWCFSVSAFLFCGCLVWSCRSPPLMYCLSGIVSLKAFTCLPLSSLLVLCLYFAFPSAASLSGSFLVFCHLSCLPPAPTLVLCSKFQSNESVYKATSFSKWC